MTDVQLKEGEQQALADQALAEFASAYGLEMPAAEEPKKADASAPAPPVKDMGPGVSEG
jgi:hypothetical protein